VLARTSGQVPYPMLHYYRAFVAEKSHEREMIQKSLNAARESDLELEIYPFRRESMQILNRVRQTETGNPTPEPCWATCSTTRDVAAKLSNAGGTR
jgi:hypothetical protein